MEARASDLTWLVNALREIVRRESRPSLVRKDQDFGSGSREFELRPARSWITA